MANHETPQERETNASGESLKRLPEDLVLLIRKELELARDEMVEKVKTAGIGAGMFSVSALAALFTLASLTALLMLALSLVLRPWLAALIVTVIWAAVAALLALGGKKKIEDATPLVPEQTIQQVKEDVQWARSGMKSDRR